MALAVPTDVAEFAQVAAAAAKVEEELGPLDVWVNNASTSVFATFVDIEPEEFRRVTEVSYLASSTAPELRLTAGAELPGRRA